LKQIGFKVGQRLAHRLSFPLPPFYDSKDAVKFICKDLWFLVFRQQASRLQASKRGVYIIHDSNFPRLHALSKCVQDFQGTDISSSDAPVSDLSPSPDKRNGEDIRSQTESFALLQMHMTAGIIEGFLNTCGHHSSVECILSTNLPSCSFQVTILESKQTASVHIEIEETSGITGESAMI
jgi:hypothetical protein